MNDRMYMPYYWAKYEYQYDHNITYARSRDRFPIRVMIPKLYCRADRDIILGTWFMKLYALRKMVRLYIDWYNTHIMQPGTLILRNRRDRLPDVYLDIRYHITRDAYFAAAFSMNFMKDIEDGCLVIHTAREGMSQKSVEMYWDVYRNKKDYTQIYDFLNEEKIRGHLENTIQEFITIADKWDDPGFQNFIMKFFDDYVENTLYNKTFICSKRLELFISQDPLLAEYIWKSNFASRNSRTVLVGVLDISLKNQKAFINAETIDQLKQTLIRKADKTSHYDCLPDHLKQKITIARDRLENAKKGVRVGLRGRYINSEQIVMAQTKLDDLWKEADRWIGLNKR